MGARERANHGRQQPSTRSALQVRPTVRCQARRHCFRRPEIEVSPPHHHLALDRGSSNRKRLLADVDLCAPSWRSGRPRARVIESALWGGLARRHRAACRGGWTRSWVRRGDPATVRSRLLDHRPRATSESGAASTDLSDRTDHWTADRMPRPSAKRASGATRQRTATATLPLGRPVRA